jgi:hypothetical protein
MSCDLAGDFSNSYTSIFDSACQMYIEIEQLGKSLMTDAWCEKL